MVLFESDGTIGHSTNLRNTMGKTTDFKLIGRVVVKGEKCTSLRILEGWIGMDRYTRCVGCGKIQEKTQFSRNMIEKHQKIKIFKKNRCHCKS